MVIRSRDLARPAAPATGGSGTVLHVEDSGGLRLTRRRTLAAAGFNVTEATGVADARLALRDERPDVVLTDLHLPDGDGYELTRWIKAQPHLASTRVVQISAIFVEAADRVRGLRSGADAYLIEPADPAELVAVIESMVRGRRAETALLESEARFRMMADASPLMVWVTDAGGGIEFVNKAYCQFFGVSEEQVRRQDWQPFVHPDDADRYVNAFMTSLRDGTPFFAEARVRRADGHWRHIASYGSPRTGQDGRVLGCVGSSPDVTDMREAAARVSEAMRLKDEFLASVAHELRQPISAALAAVGVMDARPEPAAQERARAVLNRQLLQMSRMVDDLLDASRIVRGDVPLRRSTVELREVLGNALDTTASMLQERGHHIETDIPDTKISIDADPCRLQQVFVNVLTNAAKYTPGPGRIRVAVQPDQAHVTVRVQDTGVGIPVEALPRIFDVFVRVGGGPNLGGFGIGLAVARKLLELHGGTIEALSEGPGKGAEFVLRLPLAAS